MRKKNIPKKIDLIVLLFLPIISLILSLIFRTNLLTSSILFFGLPSLYLTLRNPRAILKTSVFTFLVSVPLTFIFDFLLVRDSAWYIVETAFPFRLFNVVTLEQFVFSFLCIYFIVSMYEQLFDRKTSPKRDWLISKRMIIFGLLAFLAALFVMMLITLKVSVVVPYSYVVLGVILGVIPLCLFLLYFPHFFMRFIKITCYFFVLSLLVEYVGLNLHQWIFPGNHYLWIFDYSGFKIPLEEIIFYFILSTPGILAYYEFLDDDRK